MVIKFPQMYIDIDASKIRVTIPPPRLSTRDKFRIRRAKRKLYKALHDMIGLPINDETKKEIENRIRSTLLGGK